MIRHWLAFDLCTTQCPVWLAVGNTAQVRDKQGDISTHTTPAATPERGDKGIVFVCHHFIQLCNPNHKR